jgi:hypothetical protein
MAVSTFNPVAGTAGIVVTRKKPGHFVALTEDGRIDAVLAQGGVKLPDALEKRAAITVTNAQQGPNDGSSLVPAGGLKNLDPYSVTIAMPAEDGQPVVSDADRDAWSKFRVAYNVTLEATPFKVSGVVLLLFAPSVLVDGAALMDIPRDAILVNRSHIRRVSASTRR